MSNRDCRDTFHKRYSSQLLTSPIRTVSDRLWLMYAGYYIGLPKIIKYCYLPILWLFRHFISVRLNLNQGLTIWPSVLIYLFFRERGV